MHDAGAVLRIERIVGSRAEPALSEALHRLEHRGLVDALPIEPADIDRRRLRAHTKAGIEIAIALARDEKLYDGAVLLLEQSRAIVVRVNAERWLRLTPRTKADAVELGYHAGNLHWRVRFQEDSLLVALEAPAADYLARLGGLVTEGRVVSAMEAPAMEAPAMEAPVMAASMEPGGPAPC
ncbi:MAG TPA: urease accessory protein UreE [Acetobacteraceae bacterium]|nr:urease accessory protein UreE [Acetobacteraceae bacterium]